MAGDDGGGGFAAFMSFVDKKEQPTDAGKAQQEQQQQQQDEYHYEEEQEREAMMKTYHHPMKQWFREHPRLADKYGAYPLFWQELKAWAPYREVLKLYIKFTESGSMPEDEAPPSKTTADPTTDTKGDTKDGVKDDIKDGAKDSAKAQPSSNDSSTGASAAPAADPPAQDDGQARKKRKSRWGEPVDEAPAPGSGEGEKRRKKSRWAPAGNNVAAASSMASLLSQKQQQSAALRTKLDVISQRLATVAADAARMERDPRRSPSPPPQYDANGKRTNTREVRMRTALEKSRQETIEQLMKINPMFRPPADYQRQRLQRKIYIPIKEFPSYNFIGLIIGPRGNTQKRMEKETGCKIAIRGKGSVKEGSRGKKSSADENDDLHVLITGEREDDINRAAKEVEALLVPVDDMRNAHKQKQLRELALINGTLRDDDFCHMCGEKGHRQWECPNRDQSFKTANVKCAICGDSSHPTRDCTQKRKSAAESAAIDEEYQSFMQQLGEKPVISSATRTTSSTSAPAPWLQPVKTSASNQPWMTKQSVGAPGTVSAAAGAPGVYGPSSTSGALGSTPATAYPPPTALGATPATAYPPPTVLGASPATAYPPPTALGASPATAYPPPTASMLGATPATAYPPPTALGATPATAFPPPTASMLGATPETAYPPPTAASYAGYAQQSWGTGTEQQQEWTQADYNAYYAQWGQSAAGAAGTEYQYAQYGAAGATSAAADPATGTSATSTAADYKQQYPPYSNAPQ